MSKINCANFVFAFEFGKVRDAFMRAEILIDDKVYSVPCEWSGDVGQGTVQVPVTLPSKLIISLSGKGPNDTLVDDQGNITQDCYAKLTDVYIDSFRLSHDHFLHKKIILQTENGQAINTSYFGFNGTVQMDLDKNSVFSQYCALNRPQ